MLSPKMAGPRPKLQQQVSRLHRTRDVPQADRLGNVRRLVAALRDGIRHAATLHDLLDVDRRHFLYYRQAAVILGLIEFSPRGEPVVTSLGARLLASDEGSGGERQVFAEAIASARALRPFASFFAGEAIELADLARRLEILTGLSHTTAERRAQTLIKWRRYIRGEGPSAVEAGSALGGLATEVERMVARENARVKQAAIEWLSQIEPSAFERLVADLLRALGYTAIERGGPFDGGVDVVASRTDEWGHEVRVAVQAKRYSKPVGRRAVDELIGVLARGRFTEGLLVTTSEFSSHALEAAKDVPSLKLVDGPKFVDMLAKHGVILRYGRFGELIFCAPRA